MSFKSNKSHSKLNSFDIKLDDQMQQMGQTIGKCIDEDLSLLKPTIDWSQLAQQMPESKRQLKNQMMTSSEIISQLDKINDKIQTLNNKSKQINVTENELNLHSLSANNNQLNCLLPTFKKLVDNFADKYNKQAVDGNDSLNDKLIDVEEERVKTLLRVSQQMQQLYQMDKHLNTFNKM